MRASGSYMPGRIDDGGPSSKSSSDQVVAAGLSAFTCMPPPGTFRPGDPVVVLQRAHVLDHLRAELVGDAAAPVEWLAAVSVGVDDFEAVATHGRQ